MAGNTVSLLGNMASLALVIPLGTLAAGLVIEIAGLRALLVVFAAANALLALAVAALGATREL